MSSPNLYTKWSGLGITFQENSPEYCSPETVILETIRYGNFPKDRKFFGLLLLWLQEYSEYVHVERLQRMLKGLPSHELALLGGLVVKIRNVKKDYRFDSLLKKIRNLLGEYGPSFDLSDHPFFIERHGLDEEFAAFGIKVAQLQPADKKKILSERQILGQHLWLYHRCMFGVNFRADIATVIKLYNPPNGYQASKLAGCSTNAGYRHWGDFMKIGWGEVV
jgi:hypothetical protein